MLDRFETLQPRFGGVKFRHLPRRFKRTVHALDSTTIKLFANGMDRAKRRRREAAAKRRLRLNLESFPPAFAIVDSARGHDSTKAHELRAVPWQRRYLLDYLRSCGTAGGTFSSRAPWFGRFAVIREPFPISTGRAWRR